MTDATSDRDHSPPWKNPRVVAATVGSVIFLVFVLQNARTVQVRFLFWEFNLRLIVLMILCTGAGAGLWELGKYLWRRRSELVS